MLEAMPVDDLLAAAGLQFDGLVWDRHGSKEGWFHAHRLLAPGLTRRRGRRRTRPMNVLSTARSAAWRNGPTSSGALVGALTQWLRSAWWRVMR